MYHRFLENLHLSRVDQQIKWSVSSSSWIACSGKQDCMRTIGVASKRIKNKTFPKRMAMPSSCPKIVPNDLLPQSQNKNIHCYCTYSKNSNGPRECRRPFWAMTELPVTLHKPKPTFAAHSKKMAENRFFSSSSTGSVPSIKGRLRIRAA